MIAPPLHRSSAVGQYGMGVGVQDPSPPLPTQVLTGAQKDQKKPRAMKGQEDWEYVHQRGAEPEGQPLPGGSSSHCTEALGLWGQRKGLPHPSLNSSTVQTGPLLCGMGEQRERGEQRLLLGPSGGQRQGPWQRGCPSIICDTLGSQLLLHPGQVGGVWVPKPESKEK